jgi:hypothetical protein
VGDARGCTLLLLLLLVVKGCGGDVVVPLSPASAASGGEGDQSDSLEFKAAGMRGLR